MSDTFAPRKAQMPRTVMANGTTSRRFGSLRAVAALMIREMSTQYGRTPGGFIWTVLQPLGAIAVLSVGFSLMLRSPSLGTSFLFFYGSGYVFFAMYSSIARTVGSALKFNAPLLRYPAVTWVDAFVARFVLNSIIGCATGGILIGGLILYQGSPGPIDFVPILQAAMLTMLFGFAVGAFNCAVKGIFPLYGIIWDIVTRPLMIASGVIFIYEDLPELAQDILWYNPLIHITALARQGFYSIYDPQWISVGYVALVSLVPLFFGVVLTRRYYRDILDW